MSKKKKTDRNIRGKVLNIFKENPAKLFNYKQIASKLNIKDTQKRNSVIKAIGQLNAQKIINQKSPGKYVFVVDNRDFIEGIIGMTIGLDENHSKKKRIGHVSFVYGDKGQCPQAEIRKWSKNDARGHA